MNTRASPLSDVLSISFEQTRQKLKDLIYEMNPWYWTTTLDVPNTHWMVATVIYDALAESITNHKEQEINFDNKSIDT